MSGYEPYPNRLTRYYRGVKRTYGQAFGVGVLSGQLSRPKVRRLSHAPGAPMPYNRRRRSMVSAFRGTRHGARARATMRARYPRRRRIISKRSTVTQRRRRRTGRSTRIVNVGMHWPPSVMRWTGTSTTNFKLDDFVNSISNVTGASLTASIDNSWSIYVDDTTAGALALVARIAPRNFVLMATMYTNYRMVGIEYTITIENNNLDDWFRGYILINTSTQRSRPIDNADTVARPTGAGNQWATIDGVTKVLDEAREVRKFIIPNASNNPYGKTIKVRVPASAFTKDRYGVRVLGGRFNTDGTGPGEAMSALSSDRTTLSWGLKPQVHLFICHSSRLRDASLATMGSVSIKQKTIVEFFNRKMQPGV